MPFQKIYLLFQQINEHKFLPFALSKVDGGRESRRGWDSGVAEAGCPHHLGNSIRLTPLPSSLVAHP